MWYQSNRNESNKDIRVLGSDMAALNFGFGGSLQRSFQAGLSSFSKAFSLDFIFTIDIVYYDSFWKDEDLQLWYIDELTFWLTNTFLFESFFQAVFLFHEEQHAFTFCNIIFITCMRCHCFYSVIWHNIVTAFTVTESRYLCGLAYVLPLQFDCIFDLMCLAFLLSLLNFPFVSNNSF